MLDYFCIFTKGGAILWTFQVAALKVRRAEASRCCLGPGNDGRGRGASQGNPIEALIRTCLLEDRSGEKSFTYTPKDGAAYALKWRLHNVRPSPLQIPPALTANRVTA